jgi:Kef-type K+ transport system membrane component KefB
METNTTTSKYRYWLLFGVILAVVAILIYGLTIWGKSLETNSVTNESMQGLAAMQADQTIQSAHVSGWDSVKSTLWLHISQPFALLLLQLISILFMARLLGNIFNRMGQPTVIGEIMAGILLGPSVLGYLWPNLFNGLFPGDSLNNIYYLSQVGLVLFMFVIGMELNVSSLKSKLQETFIISQSGILLPFVLGMMLAIYLYQDFAAGQTHYLPFALFIGISLSITAFPVLARIIQERDLSRTHLGTMSMGRAAIGDVTAWCLLAAIIAISKTGSMMDSLFTLLLTIAYVLLMLFVVKPFLKRIGEHYRTLEVVNRSTVAFFFMMLLACYFINE